MAKKEISLRSWLTPKLRKLSYQWGERKKAQAKARVSRGLYECAECKRQGKTQLWGPRDISFDHIVTVVPKTGWDSWDGFLTRLFCSSDNLQCLCNLHHDEKTAQENAERKIHRKIKKKLDNDDDI